MGRACADINSAPFTGQAIGKKHLSVLIIYVFHFILLFFPHFYCFESSLSSGVHIFLHTLPVICSVQQRASTELKGSLFHSTPNKKTVHSTSKIK